MSSTRQSVPTFSRCTRRAIGLPLSSVAKVNVVDLTRELVPFMISIFAVLVLITFVPGVVTWLPKLIMG